MSLTVVALFCGSLHILSLVKKKKEVKCKCHIYFSVSLVGHSGELGLDDFVCRDVNESTVFLK